VVEIPDADIRAKKRLHRKKLDLHDICENALDFGGWLAASYPGNPWKE
jgi:hypothetical protein